MGDLVKVDIEGGIHRITLNRPEVMNALNRDLRRNLTAALVAGHSARVIVLTGAGRGFCSGQDLSDAGGLDEAGFEAVLNGQADALLGYLTDEGVRLGQTSRKPVTALRFADLGVNLVGTGIVARSDLLREKAELVRRCGRAIRWSTRSASPTPGPRMRPGWCCVIRCRRR